MSKNKSVGMKKKFTIWTLLIYIFLILFAITTIYPMLWVVQNSFKTSNDIMSNSFALPTTLLWDNFKTAIVKMNIFKGYANSLIISGSVVLFAVFFGSLASYILARFHFRGQKFIKTLVIGSLLIPIFATILPVFRMLLSWKMIDTHRGVILPQIANNLPFTIMLLTSFMETIPLELEEAAIVEGGNTWQVFSRIIMPISKPAVATTATFAFLWSYNDLFTSLIIIRSKGKFPINRLLNEISSQYGTDYGLLCAVIVLIIIPVLTVYMLAQNQIVEGMTAGAIKG
ncbi:sugar ABC transporter permease [Vallitalea longa]|uniref:Sugar ABC transporter permease n=1 Tax=Vallitalea longa TaxID=2936439 RepID=A0A9W5YA76_9FIRM|nr:carbohydrate ABC transporter permease [Vallitalea longa]GKX28239.1 sugar ABC transporter permease [Vallitalea longa]